MSKVTQSHLSLTLCVTDMKREDMIIPIDPFQEASTFTIAERLKPLTQLRFGKLAVKENPVICEQIGIKPQPYPTKVLFKNGKIVDIIDSRNRK